MNNILIIGDGQLGSAFATYYGSAASQVKREELGLATASAEDYAQILETYKPSVVINTAAYTAVDKAQSSEPLAKQINSAAPGLLADACKQHNALLVHYSTDYVFDGNGSTPWQESDKTNPINAYGKTKLTGEEAIVKSGANHLIFRISWVYNETGANFVNTMLRLASQREELSIIDDQIGAPCYATDIAAASAQAIDGYKKGNSGIYHMCNAGKVSWHGFALEIFNLAQKHGQALAVKSVKPIPTSEYPTPATRPLNSRLDCTKLKDTFDITLPNWQDGLTRCMEKKYAS